MVYLDTLPVTALEVKLRTGKYPVLTKFREFVLRGLLQTKGDQELTLYYKQYSELSVQDGCVL